MGCTKQVMHNTVAQHLLTDTKTVLELHHPLANFPSLYTGHDIIRYEYPFGSFRFSCPCCVPSQLLLHSQSPLAGQHEKLKSP